MKHVPPGTSDGMIDPASEPFASYGVTGLRSFTDADAAVDRISEIYDKGVAIVREAFAHFVAGEAMTGWRPLQAYYPFLGVRIERESLNLDAQISFGALHDPGVYGTTLTRPSLFHEYYRAERVDYSLQRLHHYTGTAPEHVQRFILLTNYQRYVDNFIEYARREVEEGDTYELFVEPGDAVTPNPRLTDLPASGRRPRHLPQMPACHLVRPDRTGITMVNIGTGPSNARNITDHLAVLRPHCWLMLGHCAGLRRSQRLGDYVLAHAYAREDHVLDQDLPLYVAVPPIAEVQVALQQAVVNVSGLTGREIKTRMRTGTVASTDNRNWELRYDELFERLNQQRAIAVDMESATIAANGFRFRVPYGTLLCVSDKPLHGELKLRGMANAFYRERISQHLLIGIEAIRILRDEVGPDQLHSRKLRSFDEPAFR